MKIVRYWKDPGPGSVVRNINNGLIMPNELPVINQCMHNLPV